MVGENSQGHWHEIVTCSDRAGSWPHRHPFGFRGEKAEMRCSENCFSKVVGESFEQGSHSERHPDS